MELPFLVEALELTRLEEAQQRAVDQTVETVTLHYSDGGFRKFSFVLVLCLFILRMLHCTLL